MPNTLLCLHKHPAHLPMQINHYAVTSVALPAESGVGQIYKTTHLADAYAIALPEGTSRNPELLANFIFAQQAPWIGGLMKIRDVLVAGFGLKTSGQLLKAENSGKVNRIGIFRIYACSAHEIILGEDDIHLDFRLSVFYQERLAEAGAPHLIVSTVVHCHNLLGRIYIFLIAPFHRLVIKSILRRAAHSGWPKATST